MKDRPKGIADVARIALEKTLLWISVVILLTMAAVVIGAIAFRRFGNSLEWYDEVSSVLMVWLTYFGCGLAALRGAHLDFSNLLMKLPIRIRVAAFLVGKAVSIVFFAVIAWAGYALLDVFADETLITLEWVPLSVTQSVLPIGCVLFIVAELLVMPKGIVKLRMGLGRDDEEIRNAIEAVEKRP